MDKPAKTVTHDPHAVRPEPRAFTTDPEDPALGETLYNGMRRAYLVLDPVRRNLPTLRPVRHVYTHQACGEKTRLSEPMARTLAHSPGFYRELYCIACKSHFLVREGSDQPAFIWTEDDKPVGEY